MLVNRSFGLFVTQFSGKKTGSDVICGLQVKHASPSQAVFAKASKFASTLSSLSIAAYCTRMTHRSYAEFQNVFFSPPVIIYTRMISPLSE